MIGTVGVDDAPAAEGFGRVKRGAIETKDAFERDLGALKVGMDVGTALSTLGALRVEAGKVSDAFSAVARAKDQAAARSAGYLGIGDEAEKATASVRKLEASISSLKAQGGGGNLLGGALGGFKKPEESMWGFSGLNAKVDSELAAVVGKVEKTVSNLKATTGGRDLLGGALGGFEKPKGGGGWNFSGLNVETKEAAGKAGEEAGGSWLAGFAKKLRSDDRKTGELVLGSFLGRGMGGLADMGASALNIGVPVMIGTFAVKGINDMLTKVNELNAAVARGEANWADVGMEVGKSVPGLGEVVRLGETINETLTGEKARRESITREIQAANAAMDAQVALSARLRDIRNETMKTVGNEKAAAAGIGKSAEEAELLKVREEIKQLENPGNQRLMDKKAREGAVGEANEAIKRAKDAKKEAEGRLQAGGKGGIWGAIDGLIPGVRPGDLTRGWYAGLGSMELDIQSTEKAATAKKAGDEAMAKAQNVDAAAVRAAQLEKLRKKEAELVEQAKRASENATRSTESAKTDATGAADLASLRGRGEVYKAEKRQLELDRDREIRSIEERRTQALETGKFDKDTPEAKKINADADEAVLKRKEVHAAAMRDLEAKQARQTLSIEEETKAKQLQLADDALGAELKRIEASYAEKYATADAGNKKLLLKQEDADKALAKQAAARRTEAMQSDVKARELDMKGDDQGAVVERAKQKYVEAVRAAGTDPKAREAAAKSFVMDVTGGLQEAPRAFAPASQMFSQQIVPMSSGPESPVQKLQGIKDTLEKILTAVDPKNAKVVEAVLKDITPVTVGG
jgi:hypothetical protein